MSILPSDTRLRGLYNKYLYLDDSAYYDKVRFYEQNENDVFNMRLEDSLWIQSGYVEALYKISDYKKYMYKSQALLERLIFYNISYFNGENLYEETLYKRSTALYHMKEYSNSIHHCEQLIKINPKRRDSAKVLFYAIRSSHVKALKVIKAGLIAALLGAAFLLLFHQIVVVSFFPEITLWFLQLITGIFVPIFLMLILSKLLIDFISWRKMSAWVNQCKANKA